jgi:hypothetical protein
LFGPTARGPERAEEEDEEDRSEEEGGDGEEFGAAAGEVAQVEGFGFEVMAGVGERDPLVGEIPEERGNEEEEGEEGGEVEVRSAQEVASHKPGAHEH